MKTTLRLAIILTVAAAAIAAFVFKGKPPALSQLPAAAANAESSAAAAKLPKLIDLGAGKCVPCKLMFPVIEELKKEYAGRLNVEFIDVWQNPQAAKQYGIEIIPTQIFYDADGKELFRHVGFFAKADILAKWQELGVNVGGVASTNTPTNRAVAFYFHGTVRCETCLKIESLARETIQRQFAPQLADGRLAFTSLDYDQPENHHYLAAYQLPCPSLVLVRQGTTNGEPWKLLGDTWQLVEDTNKFNLYVETEVARFLRQD